MHKLLTTTALAALLFAASGQATWARNDQGREGGHGGLARRVLLLSIDGMHAVDFADCAAGGYCPNLAALAQTGVNFTETSTSRPSDSFPGLTALVTGGSPRTTGAFYDVSYDRSLSPPKATTPYGITGGPGLCPGTVGTQVGYDEQIDYDYTKLDAGGGIDTDYLPRDPKNNCAPVYPHSFIRANTLFEVVRAAGGYTAWSDKHQSYELVNGPSGKGVDDYFAPEINSIPVPLSNATNLVSNASHVDALVAGFASQATHAQDRCFDSLPDSTHVSPDDAWTDSLDNIKCYDALKVQAILNEIDGKNHQGTKSAPVPNVFGMNFQAVSVGQKLNEKSIHIAGGYQDNIGTPSAALKQSIQFADAMVGAMVSELKARGLYRSTMIVVSAKHGQSPIDPNRLLRIPADNANDKAPSDILNASGFPPAQALEDDISLLWFQSTDPANTAAAVAKLEQNADIIGASGGEIYSGPLLDLLFNDPQVDPRTPNIIVQPNVGVVYTGGTKKLSEHGGFAHDDRNVMMLVSAAGLEPETVASPVETAQVAPTILAALGLDPDELTAVQKEGTQTLPGLGLHHH